VGQEVVDWSRNLMSCLEIYLRARDYIALNLRIRLCDLATVCVLSCGATRDVISDSYIQDRELVEVCPLHLLNVVALDQICSASKLRAVDLRKQVHDVEEKVADMTKSRVTGHDTPLPAKLKEDYTGLLQQQYELNVTLKSVQSTVSFAAGLAPRFRKVFAIIEDMREDIGGEALKRGERAIFEDQTEYNDEMLRNVVVEFEKLLSRIGSQINLVCAFHRPQVVTP
jgi:hypothetical protein